MDVRLHRHPQLLRLLQEWENNLLWSALHLRQRLRQSLRNHYRLRSRHWHRLRQRLQSRLRLVVNLINTGTRPCAYRSRKGGLTDQVQYPLRYNPPNTRFRDSTMKTPFGILLLLTASVSLPAQTNTTNTTMPQIPKVKPSAAAIHSKPSSSTPTRTHHSASSMKIMTSPCLLTVARSISTPPNKAISAPSSSPSGSSPISTKANTQNARWCSSTRSTSKRRSILTRCKWPSRPPISSPRTATTSWLR